MLLIKPWLCSSWLLLAIAGLLCCGCEGNPDAKRLYDDLLSTYDRLARPVKNHTETLMVKLGLKLTQLLNIDEKNQIMTTVVWLKQQWFDHKLTWDPREYGNVSALHIPSQLIWIPDLVLYNNADGSYQITIMTKATISYKGVITWEPPAVYKSSCDIDVQFFPYDVQTCRWRIGAWTYDYTKVDLEHIDAKKLATPELPDYYPKGAVDITDYHPNVEWEILATTANRTRKNYPCCPQDKYTDVTFYLVLRRKTLFYTVNYVIPVVSMTVLTTCLFYLPVVSGEKISLGVSLLVSQTLFFLLLSETIPPTSLVVPLLGKYILFAMILVSASVFLTVYVLNVHYRKPGIHKMQPWVRLLFLRVLPRYLMMKRPQFEKDRSVQLVHGVSRRFSAIFAFEASTLTRHIKNDDWKKKCPEVYRAMTGVEFIARHIQKQDEIDSIREDWMYVAMVLDRLFLYIFIFIFIVSTAAIIFQAPALYDNSPSIEDDNISEMLNLSTNT